VPCWHLEDIRLLYLAFKIAQYLEFIFRVLIRNTMIKNGSRLKKAHDTWICGYAPLNMSYLLHFTINGHKHNFNWIFKNPIFKKEFLQFSNPQTKRACLMSSNKIIFFTMFEISNDSCFCQVFLHFLFKLPFKSYVFFFIYKVILNTN
jgi:hypothetical protein